MCFDYDADWEASLCETDDNTVSDRRVRCDECRAWIPPGTPYRHVHQEEHALEDWDEDEAMEDAWADLEEDFVGPPAPPEFDPGEVFDYDCCQDCAKLRKAVYASEIEEGCGHHEAEPPLPMLLESISESGCAGRYRAKAAALFPELEASGYLERVLGWMRGGEGA